MLCPLSSVLCPLSSVLCPLSSVLCPLSSVLCPLSSVLCPLSSVLYSRKSSEWDLFSIQNRGQKGAARLVVQPEAHQGHRLRNAQTVLQAPAQQVVVASRQQETWAGKCFGGADERLQFPVTLAHGVTEEANDSRVAGDTSTVFHDSRW